MIPALRRELLPFKPQSREASKIMKLSTKSSDEFREFWFSIPIEIRKTLNIRSAVIGFNVAKSLYEAKLQAEYEDQAGASL